MILAIETAAYAQASIALVNDAGVQALEFFEDRRTVAASLVSKIADLLSANEIEFDDLAGIVVDCGPGSFTGIRIGIASASGLADGLQIPLHGVSVFELYQSAASQDNLILLDAKAGGGYYYELRRPNQEISRGYVLPADIAEVLPVQAPNGGVVMGEIEALDFTDSGWVANQTKLELNAGCIGVLGLEHIKADKVKVPEALYLHSQIKTKVKKEL